MPCYHPITAFHSPETGGVFFHSKYGGNEINLPCGQCIGCKLERSRQWAIRIMHEAQLHEENCFITLTYHDDYLPEGNTLNYAHYQRFMRNFRKKHKNIRFFMCGEYGENETSRPHYHACIFNYSFPDKTYWKTNNNCKYYRSAELEQLWPRGNSLVGELTFESAAYVARYCTKKITGPEAEKHYTWLDTNTGELTNRTPEFAHMSLKPGIGHNWLRLNWQEVQDGTTVTRGHQGTTPKYYRNYFKNTTIGEELQWELQQRQDKSQQTPDRLAVRERVAKARNNQFKRSID